MFIYRKMKLFWVMIFLLAAFQLRAEVTFTPAENAVWEIFTNRDWVQALALSEDKAILWLGSNGGLEKRNASTGELDRVYTEANGLPSNSVNALLSDEQGGVWVGTNYDGIAHLKADGSWQVFNRNNSNLPDNFVRNLLSDEQGGVWISTSGGGLTHLKADGSWQVFNMNNSNLPSNFVSALLSDEQGGVWVGIHGFGLAHLKTDDSWQIFKIDNSNLPSNNRIAALLSDTQGGIWVGTWEGLAHFKKHGSWQVFNTNNSNLPDNWVISLHLDAQGGVWVGTREGGLAHLKADSSWQVFNTDNSNLPSNYVSALISDNQGGVWVGTWGIVHIEADGSWQVFNTDNSNLPENWIQALILYDQGGIWIGTYHGITHLKVDGSWQVFNTDNSNLPENGIQALISDAQGGIWVGTAWGGLAHLHADGSWQVFNTDNSNLPSNYVSALISDAQGGVWVGTAWGGGLAHLKADGSWHVFDIYKNMSDNRVKALRDRLESINALLSDDQGGVWIGTGFSGLVHFKADGSWQFFNTDNSNLPSNYVSALLSDEQGGIWIGTDPDYYFSYSTDGGLVHLKADGSWQVFNTDNSNLPSNEVSVLLSDEQGGVWLGTSWGLAHLKADGSWQVFNTDNSNLPSNEISTLISDNQGGIWVGTWSGLAHFKPREPQNGKRAAIIIAGGGNQATNTLWDTTESISTYFYKMLNKRKFVNSEIYYLSSHPWADFNGDGFNDKIVDVPRPVRPITLDDVKKSFEWAKEQGKLDQPLYVFFIDHGGEGKLQLAKNTNMSAEEFKGILDDYQQATGNQVVALLEACYSGSHLPILAAPNRAIISSAKDNELAYFEDEQGFSRFFTKNLMKGMNFLEAFDYSVQQQGILLAKMDERLAGGSAEYVATTQTPQCDDNGDGVYNTSDGQWLKQIMINGNIQTGDFTLAVESLTASTPLQVSEPFSLRAKASTASGHVKRVWAVIRPPRINLVIDSNGTPILAYPTQELSEADEADVWAGTWDQAVYNGDYEISFYAKDNEGNIEMSEKSVVISVTGGIEPPASASVDIVIEKDQYARGEPFKFEFVEQLGWGYDLYVAVVLPGEQFITLEGSNKFAKLNQPEKWYKSLKYNENVTAIDMMLPSELPTGTYCLYGILSPQGDDPLAVKDKWVSSQQCFEVY